MTDTTDTLDTATGPAVTTDTTPGVRAPRTTLTAEAITAALAAHPTRSSAAEALGVDLRSLRRMAIAKGIAWPRSLRAPGGAGGAWSGAARKETARKWAENRRKARGASP